MAHLSGLLATLKLYSLLLITRTLLGVFEPFPLNYRDFYSSALDSAEPISYSWNVKSGSTNE